MLAEPSTSLCFSPNSASRVCLPAYLKSVNTSSPAEPTIDLLSPLQSTQCTHANPVFDLAPRLDVYVHTRTRLLSAGSPVLVEVSVFTVHFRSSWGNVALLVLMNRCGQEALISKDKEPQLASQLVCCPAKYICCDLGSSVILGHL